MKRLKPLIMVLLFSAHSFAGDGRYSVPLEDSPSIGPVNAPVTMIEFVDYQ